jgi:hypothetical protein
MLLRNVVVRHLVRLHQIREPHFVRLPPRLSRDSVESDFEREAHAGTSHAAVGKNARLVRRHRPRAAAVVVHFVWTGQDRSHLRRFQARGKRIQRIRSGIDCRIAIDREKLAVAVGIKRDLIIVLAAVRIRGELLAPVFEPAHGALEMPREPRETDFLGKQDAFIAEPAADIGGDHADRRLV